MLFLWHCYMFYLHFHTFYNIFWTNLQIQCLVPVSVYFVYALQKKVKIKYAQKILEKFQKFYLFRRHPKAWKGVGEDPPGGRAPWWHALPLGAPPGHLGGWGPPPGLPSRLYLSLEPKIPEEESFAQNLPLFRRCPDFNLGRRSSYLFRHPVGGRRPSRRPLRLLDCLPNDVWVVPPWTMDPWQ